MKPRVYVILVNWNGEVDTIACLNSLLKVQYSDMHVVISDNGSRDSSLSALHAWVEDNLPASASGGIQSCEILENGTNLGFTGANTAGIYCAITRNANYVLFLNNDTIVTPDFLDHMIQVAEAEEKCGIVGCKILGRPEDDNGQGDKIWSLGGYAWKFGIPLNIASGQRDNPERNGKFDNDMINGCCMLIKREVIDQIGVQDDELFFGMDDADYSLRAREAGWRNIVTLDAKIYHVGSHSVGTGSPLQAYYLFRNMPYLRLRHFPWYRNLIFLTYYVTRYVVIGSLGRALLGRHKTNKAVRLAISDFLAGRMGPCMHPEMLR